MKTLEITKDFKIVGSDGDYKGKKDLRLIINNGLLESTILSDYVAFNRISFENEYSVEAYSGGELIATFKLKIKNKAKSLTGEFWDFLNNFKQVKYEDLEMGHKFFYQQVLYTKTDKNSLKGCLVVPAVSDEELPTKTTFGLENVN